MFDSQPDPVRPYWQEGQPSSGWSGSDTSRDSEPARLDAQKRVWLALRDAGEKGLTWSEAAAVLNNDPRYDATVHHGTASGALSNLHQAGHAARLTEKRLRRKVYVLPAFTAGRDTEPFTVKASRKDLAAEAFAAGVAHGLAKAHASGPQPDFDQWWDQREGTR